VGIYEIDKSIYYASVIYFGYYNQNKKGSFYLRFLFFKIFTKTKVLKEESCLKMKIMVNDNPFYFIVFIP
jgi:hypothetical protein